MKEKTDVDRIKAFFRKNYPVHAKEWSENAWKKCPVKPKALILLTILW